MLVMEKKLNCKFVMNLVCYNSTIRSSQSVLRCQSNGTRSLRSHVQLSPTHQLNIRLIKSAFEPLQQQQRRRVAIIHRAYPFQRLAAESIAAAMPISWPLLLGAAAAAWAIITLVRFARAHADLTLLSKPSLPPEAFANKVVWIVGASQGLGESLALHFACMGARLILSSRSLDKLEHVRVACTAYIPAEAITVLPLDLTGPFADIDSAAAEAFEAFDAAGVDYVIHNAGASQHAAAEEVTHEVASQLLALNLAGPIALARATLPAMLRRGEGGRHVVVASMSAVVPSPGQAVYAAAKSGLRAYFASVNAELADTGVSATVCCPGPLATGGDESKPRSVYGARGLVQHGNTGMSSRRVPASLAAALIAKAAYHRLDECWIAYHPVLLVGYLMQYVPSIGMRILKRVGPGRVKQLRDGSGSGYDVGGMLKGAARIGKLKGVDGMR